MEPDQDDNLHVCLIGGSGRSGTSILKQVFSQHPDAAGIPEFRITVDPGGLLDFYSTLKHNWNPYLFDQRIKELKEVLKSAGNTAKLSLTYRKALKFTGAAKNPITKMDAKYAGIGLSAHVPEYMFKVDRLIDDLTQFHYTGAWTGQKLGQRPKLIFRKRIDTQTLRARLAQFYLDIALSVCINQHASYFLDDNTWNMLYFDSWLDLKPDLKLVHIYRHPLDVTASLMQQPWAPSDPVQAAIFYSGIMDEWLRKRKDLPSESFIEVSLEELVENTEQITRKIADFWELEWHPSLLETDLSKAHTGRWKKDIPENKIDRVLAVLKPYLTKFSYV